MKKLLFGILMFLAVPAFSQGQRTGQVTITLAATTGNPLPNNGNLIGSGITYHRISWNVPTNRTLSSCQVKLEKSVDNSNWSDLIAATSCTSNGVSAFTSGVANYIRINASSFSGEGNLTVTYNGYVQLAGGNGAAGLNATPVNGALLIGNATTGTYDSATLTAGSNVTITNAAGGITIASSGGGGGAVSSVTGDSNNISVSPTTGDTIVTLADYLTLPNSSPSVSAANKGILKYDTGTQTFQTSVNGGAFASIASGGFSGSGTTGTIPLLTGATALGDSIVTQSGTSSIAVAGGVNVNGAGVSGVSLYAAETSSSDPRGIMSAQYSTNTVGARIQLRKGRGTEASPTTVVTGDVLGRLRFSGYDGTNYLQMGSIDVNSTGTIASTRVPTTMVFSTATDAAPSVLTAALTLGSDQSATFASNVSLAGALTITQGTIAANSPAITGTTTWNNSGVTFTGLKWNTTDTASAAASLLMDLQLGGTSYFKVAKSGQVSIGNAASLAQLNFGNSNHFIKDDDSTNTMTFSASGGATHLTLTGASLTSLVSTITGGDGINIAFRAANRGGNTGLGLSTSLIGGNGSTSGTPTNGGQVNITAGSGAAGSTNGGNVVIDPGALFGGGTNGEVLIATVNSGTIRAGGNILPFVDNTYSWGDSTHRIASITGVSLKYGPSGSLTFSATAPTISSGFGTSPSITAGGAASFRLNVGTGGAASTGVIALPTATTGWNCFATDITTTDSFITAQTASTTTTASFKNYSRTTGTAIAWTDSDVLAITCSAY